MTELTPDLELILGLDDLFITHERTGNALWRGGAFLELFFPDGHTLEQRRNMIAIWEEYFGIFRDKMSHYLENDGRRSKRIEAGTFPEHFRDVVASLGEDQWFDGRLYGYMNEIRPGDPTHHVIGGGARGTIGKPRPSTISTYLPSRWLIEHREAYIEAVLRWCSRIKPLHGMSGLSMVRDMNSPPYSMRDTRAFPFLKRFPGLDYMDTAQFNLVTGGARGIRGVNWLTILGETYVDELGGEAAITMGLGSQAEITVHRFNGGVLIRSGDLPSLGDVNAGRFPEAYRPAAGLVKPIRFEDYSRKGYFRVPPPLDEVDETLKWVRRFD
ncbi:type VI immunity family protein [Fulvimarina sp. MAC8]|uniref:type VI immunity family protein n=1 Tax=Fulvimarina sp. MAC8 TaxID=3162874 RepID=UPI0032EB5A54